ncbi:glycerol-3-phosphate 1-O-acyltransferase PlsB [Idiomarina xiamenensis]|uniref:Glycerol-3-phosphate acyltransferase n=1 Tax=Idiomarina xiamenensis 10-D-4 TaxID=740709 RepID=K2KFR2_9GAMM|nr:glycerol-3-phosphate 1-O-acyltransferase PlsB [Idiomarina xiamenensis]EKE81504.1 glycerol-3-phosphate acyltransferase [Idiomarina xiamenensis 10-D-4]
MSQSGWFYRIIRHPIRWLTRFETIVDNADEQALSELRQAQVVYVMRSTSNADLSIVQRAAKRLQLPDPTQPLLIGGKKHDRVMFVEEATVDGSQRAIRAFEQLLQAHKNDTELDVRVVPIGVFWGRTAGQKGRAGNAMVGDLDNPGHWRKFWLIMLSGRQVLVRLSRTVSLQSMARQHGSDHSLAQKLARVARVHFARLRYAVAGPKLDDRNAVMSSLLDTPAMQAAIADEARVKKITPAAARERAHSYLDEIAANYSETLIRVLDRFMTWMWSRIYNGIEVKGGDRIRELAQRGHEVVYMPCHRSHMDYLLLSYVIYKEGLVPPHIAAGVNLNFFPVGSLFRRGGAFFIRRSFRGNKLYSTLFREYLCWLFQQGYPVEFFTEGGRSRTGRLLAPKTGMVAMTVQGMLRGQQRPVTIVPVYLGYEHVMEVGTYLKELKGKSKEKESMFQVLGSIRKLRNFGYGYVTFGKPINLGQYLDQAQPDWRDDVTLGAQEPTRPRWLTPTVNRLAESIMRNINDAAAANAMNLTATALLSADHHALTEDELVAQLDVYLGVLREVPYSMDCHVPDNDGRGLWQQLSKLDKFNVSEDSMGKVIRLDNPNAIAMTYYRNNIVHLLVVPGMLASYALAKGRFSEAEAVDLLQRIYPMLQAELFLSHEADGLHLWLAALCEEFARQQLLQGNSQQWQVPARDSKRYFQLELLARSASETLQRYAIVLELLQQSKPLSRNELEQHSTTLAERLSAMHGINAPEFFDKKVMSTFIASLKQELLIELDEEGGMQPSAGVAKLSDDIDKLIDPAVLQTIRQSVKSLLAQ